MLTNPTSSCPSCHTPVFWRRLSLGPVQCCVCEPPKTTKHLRIYTIVGGEFIPFERSKRECEQRRRGLLTQADRHDADRIETRELEDGTVVGVMSPAAPKHETLQDWWDEASEKTGQFIECEKEIERG